MKYPKCICSHKAINHRLIKDGIKLNNGTWLSVPTVIGYKECSKCNCKKFKWDGKQMPQFPENQKKDSRYYIDLRRSNERALAEMRNKANDHNR